ncbi:hypothetical protein [Paenibacillus massiliensis]|uniref:hypothetical protein n=1 Tax=Paenibacillus massiliensis TaxID=225917 RepID=UPI0003690350|nr:hypothetical protein [Paenibacillus massiliensis]
MTNKVTKIMGATVLSVSLIAGVYSAVSAYDVSASEEGNEIIEASPLIKDSLTWDLKGNAMDPTNTFSVTAGYPNIKLYAKNTGAAPYRVEVQHISKKRVIFNETVAVGKTVEIANNDSNPLVPSGTYLITIYGGPGLPKGELILKSSDTKWPVKKEVK